MFNGEREQRARLRRGRQLRRLSPADARGVRRRRSAPQHAADVGQLGEHRPAAAADRSTTSTRSRSCGRQGRWRRSRADVVFSTPSGNFGNLTAGLMAKRAGPADRAVRRRDQRQRRRAGVSRDRPLRAAGVGARRSSNAMDVGHPSNFERMLWLYGSDLDAMRRDVIGSRFTRRRRARDDQARLRGARLPARSAQRDCVSWGWSGGRAGRAGGQDGQDGQDRAIFLATAHPAKFARDRRADHRPRRSRSRAPLAAGARGPQHIIRIRAVARSRCSGCSMAERPCPVSRRRARAAAACTAFARPSDTQPELVRDFVRDLYKYEIRCLRERYLRRRVSEERIRGPGRRSAPPLSGARAAAARVSRDLRTLVRLSRHYASRPDSRVRLAGPVVRQCPASAGPGSQL